MLFLKNLCLTERQLDCNFPDKCENCELDFRPNGQLFFTSTPVDGY